MMLRAAVIALPLLLRAPQDIEPLWPSYTGIWPGFWARVREWGDE